MNKFKKEQCCNNCKFRNIRWCKKLNELINKEDYCSFYIKRKESK